MSGGYEMVGYLLSLMRGLVGTGEFFWGGNFACGGVVARGEEIRRCNRDVLYVHLL